MIGERRVMQGVFYVFRLEEHLPADHQLRLIQRRLCEEVHLNLAYRWFCRLACKVRCRIIDCGAADPYGCRSRNLTPASGDGFASDLIRAVFDSRCSTEGCLSH